MAKAFQFQDPGEGIHEAEVVDILVSPGDEVSEGQHAFVVETDKADFEVHAPFAGTVEEIRVEEGDMVRVGDTLATLATDGGAAEAEGDDEADAAEAEGDDETDEAAEEAPDDDEAREEPEEKTKKTEKKGKAKKKTEKKTRKKKARQKGEPKEAAPREEGDEGEEAAAHDDEDEGPVPASPATRRVARELGVDLREVPPSGEGGRVLTDDVRAFAEGAGAGKAGEKAETEAPSREEREPRPAAEALPDFSRFGPVERRPLRSVRRTIARRMARSWREIPHVTHNDVADVTELEAFRRRHAERVEAEGGKLTLTVFVMKALGGVLSDHPRFNASLDTEAEELVYKRYCHVGVAFDSERGLLVPVVRDVDRKSLTELAVELRELGERVRAGDVSRDDMQGGSFTVTNVGPLGGTYFTPIINHPEVAILGLGRAQLQPVVRGTLEAPEMTARLLLPLSLGFDHRVNDGADAARLTNDLIRVLGDLEAFALSV